MLVLCSNGLTSEPLLSMMRSKMGICATAALVVTADPEYKEKDFHVPRCVKTLEALGLQVALFDLDKHPAEELLRYDVVEFIGGNPYYLLHSIRQHHAEEILQKKILLAKERNAICDRYFPHRVCNTEHPHSFCRWIPLESRRGIRLEEDALEKGVRVFHSDRFLAGQPEHREFLRIALSSPDDDATLEKGLQILKDLLEKPPLRSASTPVI
jgi:hypothetical protein